MREGDLKDPDNIMITSDILVANLSYLFFF